MTTDHAHQANTQAAELAEVELTGDEIDVLVYESGPDADHDALMTAVERIIVARLAPVLALAERCDRLAAKDRADAKGNNPTLGASFGRMMRAEQYDEVSKAIRQTLISPGQRTEGDA